MTTIYLIRHGMTDAVGKTLAGRGPCKGLNRVGFTQAGKLVQRLAGSGLAAIYSSPLARAMETADTLARSLGLGVHPREALTEIEYGAWTGCSFTCLENLPEWQRFNSFRSSTRPPGGELMLEAQARLVGALQGMAQSHPGRSVAVVTHADLIRAALCHYGCIPLDCCLRFEISPASVTVFQLHDESALVVRVNDAEER